MADSKSSAPVPGDYEPGHHPALPPPISQVGPVAWLRNNLFSTPLNTLLTLVGLGLIYVSVPPLLDWAFFSADWMGESRDDCSRDGACWVFIGAWLKQLFYGRYPTEELWRINLAYVLVVASLVWLLIPKAPHKAWVGVFLLVVFPVVAFYLFTGGQWGLVEVETSLWGGLFLTLVVAVVGIVASLPLGILLALGRRSDLPIISALSAAFIELWRGVPLITVLFMASVMFPLFLPEGLNFDKLLRALVGVTLFASAYMAEVIRGGLQAIPRGQYEAAQALGLPYWRMMGFVILPQALKLVIPGIVNTFIGLFKDTTLVYIIGLYDLLGIAQTAAQNPDWVGFAIEGYVFAGLIFWAFCFGMSRYSQNLERRLHTGH
ncbi:MAG: amino acid ABC transporter permease [Candidatus Competibacterales bacterium]